MAFDLGSIITHLKADTSNFKKGITDAKKSTGDLKSSVSSLSSFVTKAAATMGIAMGGAALVNGIKSAVTASNQLTNALLGLTTVARAMGQDVDKAKQAAMDLAKDGLMSVSDAAEGLKNLLATGFSLPEAINLMNTFKDAAAFNRQGTLAFGEAIVGATQGIKNQNSIMVDNVGITKNLSVIMKEAGLSVEDMGNVTSDASVRQKLYNGLLKEGSIFQGDAGRAAGTLSGKLAQVGTASFNLKAAIGDALAPVVSWFADMALNALNGALAWVSNNMNTLKAVGLSLGSAFIVVGQVIAGVARMIVAAHAGAWEEVKNGFYDMVGNIKNTVTTAEQKITAVYQKETDKQTTIAQKGAANQSKASSKKTQDIMKDLEKETQKFNEENAKREKNFKQSLAELIWAHQDKVKSLEQEIKDENADFEENIKDRAKSFAEKMTDMKDAHQEKVNELTAQLDEEVAKGEAADATKVADLQARILKENAEYDKQKAKAEADEADATAKLKAEHDKRVADYQTQLNQENEILKLHEADVAAVKDQARVDDITRLKLQYEEENAESKKEHDRRMVEIAERGSALGDTLGSNINAGLGAQAANIKKTAEDIGKDASNGLENKVAEGAREAGRSMVRNFVNGLVDKLKGAADWLIRQGIKTAANAVGFDPGPAVNVPAFNANGVRNFRGGLSWVGERGPELIQLPRGSNVFSNGQSMRMAGSGQVVVNLPGAIISSETTALKISEIIGDNLIKKLNMTMRT